MLNPQQHQRSAGLVAFQPAPLALMATLKLRYTVFVSSSPQPFDAPILGYQNQA